MNYDRYNNYNDWTPMRLIRNNTLFKVKAKRNKILAAAEAQCLKKRQTVWVVSRNGQKLILTAPNQSPLKTDKVIESFVYIGGYVR